MAKIVKPGYSYNSNQFYNFKEGDSEGAAGPGGRNQSGRGGNNPTNDKFMFPGDTSRRLTVDGDMGRFKVQRGFMRLLPLGKGAKGKNKPPNYRLFFQFNPQTITRDVTAMQTNVYAPILQTKEQLSQPLMGQSNFGFDLMFERTFEVNAGGRGNRTPSIYNEGPEAARNRRDAADRDLLTTLGPDEIGVLHDIRMLDAIVGQGITKELVNFMKKRFDVYDRLKQAAGEAPTTVDPATNTAASVSPEATTGYVEPTLDVEGTLDMNVGNQAILVPNPIRVVFSSLFMVDGFVTGVNVKFVKFNQYMVPTMAFVNVQMQAVYFGFARKVTPFTTALEQADLNNIEVPLPEATEETTGKLNANQEELETLFLQNLRKFYVGVGGVGSFETPTWNHASNFRNKVENVVLYNELLLRAGFVDIPKGLSNDPIYQAFGKTISSVRIIDFRLNVTRPPFTPSEKGNQNYNNKVFDVVWNPSDDNTPETERFRAVGSQASTEWASCQHERDQGGLFRAAISRKNNSTANAKFFYMVEDEFNRWVDEGRKLRVKAEMRVELVHAKGDRLVRKLSGEKNITHEQPVQITLTHQGNGRKTSPGSGGGNNVR